MAVEAVKSDIKVMPFAGACSMAIGEFASVYTQLDIEYEEVEVEEKLLDPMQAAIVSVFAFSAGELLPLMVAVFVREYKVRIAVVVLVVVASLALVVFGGVEAVSGRFRVWSSCARVFVGGGRVGRMAGWEYPMSTLASGIALQPADF
ncbi:vacuolar iron transporter homolog 1 [Ziziphus jujuba]|uniref:Vacuolar iron transporter n=1 Tax=Ziziphus jujuba TaxID=326968 RepID=A0ABM3ZRW6_ZIZJJ|nr:vacuolar iron transporter homolog 1 [Ziziphus jujuba]